MSSDSGSDSEMEYELVVERVLDMRRRSEDGTWEYLMHWKDLPAEEDAWQRAFHGSGNYPEHIWRPMNDKLSALMKLKRDPHAVSYSADEGVALAALRLGRWEVAAAVEAWDGAAASLAASGTVRGKDLHLFDLPSDALQRIVAGGTSRDLCTLQYHALCARVHPEFRRAVGDHPLYQAVLAFQRSIVEDLAPNAGIVWAASFAGHEVRRIESCIRESGQTLWSKGLTNEGLALVTAMFHAAPATMANFFGPEPVWRYKIFWTQHQWFSCHVWWPLRT